MKKIKTEKFNSLAFTGKKWEKENVFCQLPKKVIGLPIIILNDYLIQQNDEYELIVSG